MGPSHTAKRECKWVQLLCKTVWQHLLKLNIRLPWESAIPPNINMYMCHRKTSTPSAISSRQNPGGPGTECQVNGCGPSTRRKLSDHQLQFMEMELTGPVWSQRRRPHTVPWSSRAGGRAWPWPCGEMTEEGTGALGDHSSSASLSGWWFYKFILWKIIQLYIYVCPFLYVCISTKN